MYLPEEKRAQIRTCMKNRLSNRNHQPANNPKTKKQLTPDNESLRKVSQILFEARSGNEVYTPFY